VGLGEGEVWETTENGSLSLSGALRGIFRHTRGSLDQDLKTSLFTPCLGGAQASEEA